MSSEVRTSEGCRGFTPKVVIISEMLEVTNLLATTWGASPDFWCKAGCRKEFEPVQDVEYYVQVVSQ
jgi:hypothetical protein